MSKRAETVWIIGVGRAGKAIAELEYLNGSQLRLFDRSSGILKIRRKNIPIEVEVPSGKPDRLWICVADSGYDATVASLCARGVSTKLAIHTCGWNGPELLRPLVGKRGAVLAFHPMRSIPGKTTGELEYAIVSLCGDARAVKFGQRFAKLAHARTFEVAADAKPVLHTICQFAANMPYAIAGAAELLSERSQADRELVLAAVADMMTHSAHHAARYGSAVAATGPVARGDQEVVDNTLALLAHSPELTHFYRAYIDLLHLILQNRT